MWKRQNKIDRAIHTSSLRGFEIHTDRELSQSDILPIASGIQAIVERHRHAANQDRGSRYTEGKQSECLRVWCSRCPAIMSHG